MVFSRLSERYNKIALWIVFLNILFQAVIGIVHHNFFHNYILDSALTQNNLYLMTEKTFLFGLRETGFLANSNVFGNFLVLGFFVTLANRLNINKVIKVISWIVLFVAISYSGSRFALLVSFFLLLRYVYQQYNISIFLCLCLIALLVLSTDQLIFSKYFLGLQRLQSEGGVDATRVDKYLLGLNLLSEKIFYFFIGVPTEIVANSYTANGEQFSDNSYLTIVLSSGILVFSLWLSYMFFALLSWIDLRKAKYILIFLASLFMITNAILWQLWVFYYFTILFCGYKKEVVSGVSNKDIVEKNYQFSESIKA
jgi:hypothetical protein